VFPRIVSLVRSRLAAKQTLLLVTGPFPEEPFTDTVTEDMATA